MNNPCIGCGACCSYFRVSFYQGELKSVGGFVPDDSVVPINMFYVAMKGTEIKDNKRCVKLSGDIGDCASCSIYEDRPSPCRDFPASYENGIGLYEERCDKARIAHGLKPLKVSDWD
jgi:Fe-S-cluster containining protein